MRVSRFLRIVHTVGRYRLDEFLPRHVAPLARLAVGTLYFWAPKDRDRKSVV